VTRRRFSAAGLAVLTLVVAVMLVVFTTLPIRSCPTCKGVAKKVADPETGVAPVRIGCPECGDRGSVTEPRRWKGPLVPPQVTRLLQCWREDRSKEFLPSFHQVAKLSGRDPEAVLGTGSFGGEWSGGAVFLKAEGKDYVLVVLHGRGGRWNGLEGLVLLDMDGRVQDYVHLAGVNGWWLRMDLMDRPSKDETVALFEGRRMDLGGETKDDPLKVDLEGSGRTLPAQPGADRKTWLVRVKSGRFEVLSAPRE
jgi:hypothetical protein